MAKPKRVDNLDIVPLALYQLGGAGQFVDVEDVFIQCHKIAPERFKWRRHDFPNYKTLSKALRDFEARRPRLLLSTADGLSRQLTAEGLAWLEENMGRLRAAVGKAGANPPTRRRDHRLLNEFADHPFTRRFTAGERTNLNKFDAADLLLCAPDSPTAVWRERLDTYRSAAKDAGRHDVLEFLDFLRDSKPEWFGEEAR